MDPAFSAAAPAAYVGKELLREVRSGHAWTGQPRGHSVCVLPSRPFTPTGHAAVLLRQGLFLGEDQQGRQEAGG